MASSSWSEPCRNLECQGEMDCLQDRDGFSSWCKYCGLHTFTQRRQVTLEELNEWRKEWNANCEEDEKLPLLNELPKFLIY